MKSLQTFEMALILHFWGDFIFQSRWQAENKSWNWFALYAHIFTYWTVLLFMGPTYAFINSVLHFPIDAASSRASSYFFQKRDLRSFWMVIGLDQLLHVLILYRTLDMVGW